MPRSDRPLTGSVTTMAVPQVADPVDPRRSQGLGETFVSPRCLVADVDLDRLEANLQDLQSYVDAHEIALWPHTKTHKSPEIGLRQLAVDDLGRLRIDWLEKEIARAEAMLANERFVGSAPPAVVDGEREKLERFRRELEALAPAGR